jgi:hypothetical protein
LQKARHVLQCSISETRPAFNDIARKAMRNPALLPGAVPVDHRSVRGFLLISRRQHELPPRIDDGRAGKSTAK